MNSNSPALIVRAPSTNGVTNSVEAKLRDIKPPLQIPDLWRAIGWTLAILILALIIFCAWRAWQKRKSQISPAPIIPPHERARQKLQEALAFISQPKNFTTIVSDTIRVYLEERFAFHAPERTTEEFLYELQSTNLLTDDQKKSLGEFLSRCDLIKFAKYDPTKSELEELHEAAMSLIAETEPKPISFPLDPRPSTPVAEQ
ncbi:MAG: DUF4381 family protein [Limisphaerales bacterium]